MNRVVLDLFSLFYRLYPGYINRKKKTEFSCGLKRMTILLNGFLVLICNDFSCDCLHQHTNEFLIA